MRIKDIQVQTFVNTQRAESVTDSAMLRLLAALGDSSQEDAAALLGRLSQPGMSRADQLETVKAGLDQDELADVASLLDEGRHVFTAQGRNFLEALAGRAQLQDGDAALQVDAQGNVQGNVAPDETVEVLNLSTATTRSARLTDTVQVGKADAWGKFSGQVPDVAQGDVLRVQTRNNQGRVTSWLNVRAQQQGGWDPRAAFVDVSRVTARTQADGTVQLSHTARLPLSEPESTVRFTNTRLGTFVDATLDANGSIPALKLDGVPGDSITVAVSDGAGNQDFSTIAGTIKVLGQATGALEDPAPINSEAWLKLRHFDGPLFAGGVPRPQDVEQGQIGNCYVPSACAAVAAADAGAIEDLIQDNQDGTYTVTFHPNGGPAVPIQVDGDLYVSGSRPRYGRGIPDAASGQTGLWFPLVEKAWAVFKGSYDVVGQGGSVGQMMSDITGRPNKENWLAGAAPDAVWGALKDGTAQGHAMAAGTYGETENARYTGSGVHANHAYSVLGGEEVNGQRMVVLRNPWGQGEAGHDGKDDGIFRLPLDRFMNLYQVLNVC